MLTSKTLQPEEAKMVLLGIGGCAEPRLQKRKENAIMEQHFEAQMVSDIYIQHGDNTHLRGYTASCVTTV